VLDKAVPSLSLQAQVLAAALAQAAQQRKRLTAVATETPKAVTRITRPERSQEIQEKRLPDEPRRCGDLLDISA
jgi:hypothetical protein